MFNAGNAVIADNAGIGSSIRCLNEAKAASRRTGKVNPEPFVPGDGGARDVAGVKKGGRLDFGPTSLVLWHKPNSV